jgi:hypothetical protein
VNEDEPAAEVVDILLKHPSASRGGLLLKHRVWFRNVESPVIARDFLRPMWKPTLTATHLYLNIPDKFSFGQWLGFFLSQVRYSMCKVFARFRVACGKS